MSHALKMATGEHDLTAEEEGEIELLRDFQRWLENDGPYDVIVPFAPQIRAAFGRTPRAVRIRRDINTLIAGVAASAVLHKAQREIDAEGPHRRDPRRLRACLGCVQSRRLGLPQSAVRGRASSRWSAPSKDMIEVKRKAFEAASAVHRDYRERHDPDAYRDPASLSSLWWRRHGRSWLARWVSRRKTRSRLRLAAAKAAGVIECVNDNAHAASLAGTR